MSPKFPSIQISKNEWISFMLTLIATLVGVLIAIWLTNTGIRNKEKADTIKLLNTSKLILENTAQYTAYLDSTIRELENDTVNNVRLIDNTKLVNPIPYPDLLETIFSNELISKNLSGYSHSIIYNGLINLRKLAKYETAEFYLKSLDELILQLTLEIGYQKGEISLQELKVKAEANQKAVEH